MKVLCVLAVILALVFGHETHAADSAIDKIIDKHWARFQQEKQHLVRRGEDEGSPSDASDLAYKCIHDQIAHETQDVVAPEPEEGHLQGRQATTGPIRFFLNEDLLLTPNADVGKACYAAGQTVTLNTNNPKTCTAQHILTPALGDFLANDVLPAILEVVNTLIQTTSIVGPLKLANGTCQGVPIPETYGTTGVDNTDYILFATGRPAADDNVVAFAGFCQRLGSGRPIAGNINFNPFKFSAFLGASLNRWQFAGAVKVGIHELTHALGFTPALYDFFSNATKSQTTVSGTSPAGNAYSQVMNYISGPMINAYANNHYGCSTIDKIPLEEYGGSGTAGAHWEQRVIGDEYMGGYINPVMPISVLTLAFLEDMGWYKANFSAAEYWGWGKDQGCNFVSSRCEAVWPNNPDYWCTSSTTTPRCSADRRGKGVCTLSKYTTSLPAYYQHFSDPTRGGGAGSEALDYCPSTQIYSNRYCEDTNQLENGKADVYAAGSRCFPVAETSAGLSTGAATCLRHNCSSSTVLKVEYGGKWYTCPTNGGPLKVGDDYVSCPSASLLCRGITLVNYAAMPFPTNQGQTKNGGLTLPDFFGAADRSVCFVLVNFILVLIAIM